ncbi:MAG: cysteine hydrolase [Humibacillus sp.]|nr:cysteine hydrolase [Humibacillus sp.]MDN5778314.1 cysteine hydrolase [Humibacillus sp.]
MTSFTDRPATALLVVDMQNDVVADAHDRAGVIANITTLVQRARAERAPVIWVQHSDDNLPTGSAGWQLVSELEPATSEPVVHKNYGDSFEGTDLESVLAEHGVGRLVVAGAQTDACIRSTLHGALTRGYDVTLAADAHTTEDLREYGAGASPEQVIAHTNLYWSWSQAPGRKGEVVPSADITFVHPQ